MLGTAQDPQPLRGRWRWSAALVTGQSQDSLSQRALQPKECRSYRYPHRKFRIEDLSTDVAAPLPNLNSGPPELDSGKVTVANQTVQKGVQAMPSKSPLRIPQTRSSSGYTRSSALTHVNDGDCGAATVPLRFVNEKI